MNFRELFSKLDGIAEGGVTLPNADGTNPPGAFTARDQIALNKQIQDKMSSQSKDMTAMPPGAQPSLAPKADNALTPQDLKALQFPNQKPNPSPAVVTDPKADVNAMAKALQAVASQNKQPQLQPTTSAGIQQQQAPSNTPKDITKPMPGEPLEEAGLSEAEGKKYWTKADFEREKAIWDKQFLATRKAKEAAGVKSPYTIWDEQTKELDKTVKNWKTAIGNAKTPEQQAELYKSIKDPLLQAEVKKALDPKVLAVVAPPAVAPAAVDAGGDKGSVSASEKNPPAAVDASGKKDGADASGKKDGADASGKKDGADASGKKDGADASGKKDGADASGKKDGADATVKKKTGDGVLGQALAKQGVTRDNRRNQDFVDKAFGKDKYKAGTAASNYALLQWAKDGKKPFEEPQGTNTNTNLPGAGDGGKKDGQGDGTAVTGSNNNSAAAALASASKTMSQTDATAERPPSLNLIDPNANNSNIGLKLSRNSSSPATDLRTTADQLDRITQQRALDAERAAERALLDKYKDVTDTRSFRVQTGNMKKSPFDLKTGDRDIDPKTGNVMVYRAASGMEHPSAGKWEIDSDVKGQGFKERPGMGLIGPKADSDEGRAIYDRQRRQVISQDELERLNKLRAAASAPPAQAAPVSASDGKAVDPLKVVKDTQIGGGEVTDKMRQDAAAAVVKDAGAKNEGFVLMSKELQSLAEQLIKEKV